MGDSAIQAGSVYFDFVARYQSLLDAQAALDKLRAGAATPLGVTVNVAGGAAGTPRLSGPAGSRGGNYEILAAALRGSAGSPERTKEMLGKFAGQMGVAEHEVVRRVFGEAVPSYVSSVMAAIPQAGAQTSYTPSSGWLALKRARQAAFTKERDTLLSDQKEAYDEAFGGAGKLSTGLRLSALGQTPLTDTELQQEQATRMQAASDAIGASMSGGPKRKSQWKRLGWHEYFMASITAHLLGGVATAASAWIKSARDFGAAAKQSGTMAGGLLGIKAATEMQKGFAAVPIAGAPAVAIANLIGGFFGISTADIQAELAKAKVHIATGNAAFLGSFKEQQAFAQASLGRAKLSGDARAIGQAQDTLIRDTMKSQIVAIKQKISQSMDGADAVTKNNLERLQSEEIASVRAMGAAKMGANFQITLEKSAEQQYALASARALRRFAAAGDSAGMRMRQLSDQLHSAQFNFRNFPSVANKMALNAASVAQAMEQFRLKIDAARTDLQTAGMATAARNAASWSHAQFGQFNLGTLQQESQQELAKIRLSFAGKHMTAEMRAAEESQIRSAGEIAKQKEREYRFHARALRAQREGQMALAKEQEAGGYTSQLAEIRTAYETRIRLLQAQYGAQYGVAGHGGLRAAAAREQEMARRHAAEYRHRENAARIQERLLLGQLTMAPGMNTQKKSSAALKIHELYALAAAEQGFALHQYGRRHERELEHLAHQGYQMGKWKQRQNLLHSSAVEMDPGAILGEAAPVLSRLKSHDIKDHREQHETLKSIDAQIKKIAAALSRHSTLFTFH